MHKRLEKLRIDEGLSKKEFAEKLKITEQAYQNYCNGKRLIPTNVALEIKQLFNISLDWLLFGDNKNNNINYKEEIIKSLEKLDNKQMEYIYHIIKSKELEK